ncbi:MAG: hypothetical protein Kow0098_17670 [Ignavibacteriaceae bacterium]
MAEKKIDYTKKNISEKVVKAGRILLIAGLILGILAYFTDTARAINSYLVMFMFLVSIGVGSLFLVALEYVAGAEWSTPFRRITESVAYVIPFLLLIALPLLFSMHDIYHWTHTGVVENDPVLSGKTPYLNIPFFIIRFLLITGLWSVFLFLLSRNSRKQDISGDQILTKRNITLSAVFLPVFAVTITISAIDWLMSLEPHWFSTIFGVYYFSGTVIAALAAITIIVLPMKEHGYLHKKINNDHLYSFGALMFAFVNFWGYIAFSQYLLIWYADLPEETSWFLQRWEGSWAIFSILLIVIHFIVPYAALLSQPAKMDPKRLKFAAIWLLFAHYYDIYWIVMPGMESMQHGYVFSWIDFVFPLLVVGIVILIFNFRVKKDNMLPVGDPKLSRSLDFHL